MDVQTVLGQLQRECPGKQPLYDATAGPVPMISVLIERTKEASLALAVVDEIPPHVHERTTVTFEVMSGTLYLVVNGEQYTLGPGGAYTITPGQVHGAHGDAAWVKITCTPAWCQADHHEISTATPLPEEPREPIAS